MRANKLVNALIEKNITIASAESLTGGLFAAELTKVAGASKVFIGGVVSYQIIAKEKILKIDSKLIKSFGVVSKEIAQEMALKIGQQLNSDIAISFTGNAGPSVQNDLAVGRVYIGLKYFKEYQSYELNLKGQREEIRNQCIDYAIELLLKKLG
ncbi:MAG: CinA family protein [Erysipelotrichaceae bacterium]